MQVITEYWIGFPVLTKRGPLEKGMASHFSILALKNPWRVWKGKKMGQWKRSCPGQWCPTWYWRSEDKELQEEWRDGAKAKARPSRGWDRWWKQVQRCEQRYCIGMWDVRSMIQGKLEVVGQEMARVKVDTLGISELKWTGMGDFNSDDHYTYYCGQESPRRNGVAIRVNKEPKCSTWMQSQNDRMTSARFQGKPFSIMIIQAYAPTSNSEDLKLGSTKTHKTF